LPTGFRSAGGCLHWRACWRFSLLCSRSAFRRSGQRWRIRWRACGV